MDSRKLIFNTLSELSSGPIPARKLTKDSQELKILVDVLLNIEILGKNQKGIYLKQPGIELLTRMEPEYQGPELFRCRICKRDLPREAFHTNKYRKNGLQQECKECRKTLNGLRNIPKPRATIPNDNQEKNSSADEYFKQLIAIKSQQLELFKSLAATR